MCIGPTTRPNCCVFWSLCDSVTILFVNSCHRQWCDKANVSDFRRQGCIQENVMPGEIEKCHLSFIQIQLFFTMKVWREYSWLDIMMNKWRDGGMQATCRPTEDLPLRPSKSMINLEIYHKRVIISNKNRNILHVVEINNGTSFYTLYAWRQLYRDSCSINGKMKAGGAAEPMLCDFVKFGQCCLRKEHESTGYVKDINGGCRRVWQLHNCFM